MRVTHDSITDTDNLVVLIKGSSFPVVLDVLIFEREENRSTRRKTLEAQERSTMRNFNSHELPIHGRHRPDLAWLFFRGERHNALSAWPPMLPMGYQ